MGLQRVRHHRAINTFTFYFNFLMRGTQIQSLVREIRSLPHAMVQQSLHALEPMAHGEKPEHYTAALMLQQESASHS